jgi:CYTH domain-containing protein
LKTTSWCQRISKFHVLLYFHSNKKEYQKLKKAGCLFQLNLLSTLTYKGAGLMCREEYNLPLNAEAFAHLKEKIDGILIQKRRYLIPLTDKLTIELDVFEGELAPLRLAEVEFETKEEAEHFVPPAWFGEDVTFSSKYHNSTLSKR